MSQMKTFVKLNLTTNQGMRYKFHVGPHRIGHIITKGETLEDAQKLLFEAMDKVEITVE